MTSAVPGQGGSGAAAPRSSMSATAYVRRAVSQAFWPERGGSISTSLASAVLTPVAVALLIAVALRHPALTYLPVPQVCLGVLWYGAARARHCSGVQLGAWGTAGLLVAGWGLSAIDLLNGARSLSDALMSAGELTLSALMTGGVALLVLAGLQWSRGGR